MAPGTRQEGFASHVLDLPFVPPRGKDASLSSLAVQIHRQSKCPHFNCLGRLSLTETFECFMVFVPQARTQG